MWCYPSTKYLCWSSPWSIGKIRKYFALEECKKCTFHSTNPAYTAHVLHSLRMYVSCMCFLSFSYLLHIWVNCGMCEHILYFIGIYTPQRPILTFFLSIHRIESNPTSNSMRVTSLKPWQSFARKRYVLRHVVPFQLFPSYRVKYVEIERVILKFWIAR